MKDQQTLGSQQQVIDLNLAVVRVGNDESLDTGVSDFPEHTLQVVSAGAAPIDEPNDEQQQQDRQQPGRVNRIKDVCHLPEPAPDDLPY